MATSGDVKKSHNPKSVKTKAKVAEAMEELRSEYAAGEKSHHERVRANICRAYELGLMLKDSKPQWALFIKKDWEGITGGPPKEHDQAHAVRFALKFMVGNGPGAQKEASFYFRAIKKLVDGGVTPDKLRAVLQKKPLRDLAADTAAEKRAATGKGAIPSVTGSEKSKKASANAPKKAEVEKVSEQARTSARDYTIRVDSRFVLSKKAEALLGMPKQQLFTMKGRLLTLGPPIEIAVVTVKRRDKPDPAS